jgi:multisubunit Na+/H+ antiporter MnhB subunit
MLALLFAGPVVVVGWWLASQAQTNPSGGFQGGVILATALILVYLSGEFLVFKRFSPADLTDVVEAVGAGGFALAWARPHFSAMTRLTASGLLYSPSGISPSELSASSSAWLFRAWSMSCCLVAG